jgi:hypothetical protein
VLPYRFDTSAVVKLILRGAGLLLLVIMAGILYSLFISGDRAASLQLLVSGLIAGYFARLLLRNLVATRGTITRGRRRARGGCVIWVSLARTGRTISAAGIQRCAGRASLPPGVRTGRTARTSDAGG